MKALRILVLAGLTVFVLLQFVRPRISEKSLTDELQAPAEVKQIFERRCYSCHSDQRQLAWFDEIVPAYWLVRHDVLTAREHLNFSRIGAKPAATQRATLFEAAAMIQLGAMPLPRFLALHPEAKVTPEELATLKAYLAPWAPAPSQSGATPVNAGGKTNAAPAAVSAENPPPVALDQVQPEPNGLAFDPSFESWKPLSTTDRGDNNTFRFILGNDVAVKAAQSGNIGPWPDGTRFAKVAWQQEPGTDGLVHPGKFIQVELMVKEAQRYRKTAGWGWGRWRGAELKPYGSNANFQGECTVCHLPVSGNDSVYTLPITLATVKGNEVVNNLAAALPAGFSEQPLAWNAITLYVDPKTRATTILYGNDVAMRAVAARGNPGQTHYPAGAVLALVTWTQRDDPHWFGARIPAAVQSVEIVQVAATGQPTSYRQFGGVGLPENHAATHNAQERTSFILGLAPAQLP